MHCTQNRENKKTKNKRRANKAIMCASRLLFFVVIIYQRALCVCQLKNIQIYTHSTQYTIALHAWHDGTVAPSQSPVCNKQNINESPVLLLLLSFVVRWSHTHMFCGLVVIAAVSDCEHSDVAQHIII